MRNISWYVSGLQTQQEAEAQLEEMRDWARKTFNMDLWSIEDGVRHGPFGFKAELVATEVKTNNAES